MMLAENYHIVPMGSDLNLATTATQDTDSVNMSGFHSATILISCGTLAGADTNFTLNSGATAGVVSSALTFNYAKTSATALWAGAGANADVLAAWTSGAIMLIANATDSNFMFVIELEAAAMDLATGGGEEWLTGRFTDVGGCTGLVTVIGIFNPRYKSNVHPTAL